MNQQTMPAAIEAVMPAAIATGLFVSLCTFQHPTGGFSPAGVPLPGYTDVAGLVNIPCTAPPPSEARVQATEVRALAEITTSELHHVLLNGYYPALDLGWRGEGTPSGQWQMLLGNNDGAGNLVDGFAYQIMGVESDSCSQMTRVQVRLGSV